MSVGVLFIVCCYGETIRNDNGFFHVYSSPVSACIDLDMFFFGTAVNWLIYL